FMAELTSQPVKTFSIGFPEEEFSELDYARSAARHFGTDHHEYVLESERIDVLDELIWHFGEPFADASALPAWYLSKLTRKSVTVALTGDGGDELFGGYNWYQTDRFLAAASRLPPWMARIGSKLRTGSGLRPLNRIGKIAGLLAVAPKIRYAALRRIIAPEVKRLMYTPE
ncbi:MAG: asparagine synthetase B, partial [Nitrospiraceae bacterium]